MADRLSKEGTNMETQGRNGMPVIGHERLTSAQRRVLRVVQRQQDGPDEHGHDAEGDLSLCTGNLSLTLRTLKRRGLIESYEACEPDRYYTDVIISTAGREALNAR